MSTYLSDLVEHLRAEVPRPGDLDDPDLLEVEDDREPEVPNAVVLHDRVAHANQVELFDLNKKVSIAPVDFLY